MATERGIVKKTPLADFGNIRRTGIIAIDLKKDDALLWVGISRTGDQVVLSTRNGQSIRFKESDVRSMGRGAAGIHAMRLRGNDRVAGCDIIRASKGQMAQGAQGGLELLVVMEKGFAKRTPLHVYKVQRRGGSGIKTAHVTEKTGAVIGSKVLTDEMEILALSAKGQVIRTSLESVRQTGRDAQGVRIMNVKAGDRIAGVIVI